MQDLNSLTIIGRLTGDCQVHTFDNGGAVLQFSIAVNRSVKKGDEWKEEASFFNVKKSGKNFDKLAGFLTKGKQVAIEGYLKQDRWEKDGQKNSSVVIVAENLQLIGGNTTSSGDSESAPADNGDFPEDLPF